jgi:hypothetical protein
MRLVVGLSDGKGEDERVALEVSVEADGEREMESVSAR